MKYNTVMHDWIRHKILFGEQNIHYIKKKNSDW